MKEEEGREGRAGAVKEWACEAEFKTRVKKGSEVRLDTYVDLLEEELLLLLLLLVLVLLPDLTLSESVSGGI